jgi:hypothetical protein
MLHKGLRLETAKWPLVLREEAHLKITTTVGNITKGQSSIPLHISYPIAIDDSAQAANELAQGLLNSSHEFHHNCLP